MNRDQISSFLSTRDDWNDTTIHTTNDIEKQNDNDINAQGCTPPPTAATSIPIGKIHNVMDDILIQINKMMRKKAHISTATTPPPPPPVPTTYLRLRRAMKKYEDPKSILNLVNGLALYEKALDEVDVDETIYEIDGYGENPFYHCILLEQCKNVKNDNAKNKNDNVSTSTSSSSSTVVVGMAFFYFGYSLEHNGRYLYLEDLFIHEEFRGNGFGKAMMYAMADICQKLECQRFVWQALDWNTPALDFYNRIGAEICENLITLRLNQDQIDQLIIC